MSNTVSIIIARGLVLSLTHDESSLTIKGSYKGKSTTDVYHFVGTDAIQYSEAECEIADFGQNPELGLWALGQIVIYLLGIGVCKILAGDNNGGLSFVRKDDDIIFASTMPDQSAGIEFSLNAATALAKSA